MRRCTEYVLSTVYGTMGLCLRQNAQQDFLSGERTGGKRCHEDLSSCRSLHFALAARVSLGSWQPKREVASPIVVYGSHTCKKRTAASRWEHAAPQAVASSRRVCRVAQPEEPRRCTRLAVIWNEAPDSIGAAKSPDVMLRWQHELIWLRFR